MYLDKNQARELRGDERNVEEQDLYKILKKKKDDVML
jgi:hypothetical protein